MGLFPDVAPVPTDPPGDQLGGSRVSQIPLGSLSTETPQQQPQLKLHQRPSDKFCTEDTLPGACSTFCTETLLRYLLNTVHGKHSISHRQHGAQTGSEGQRGTALTQTKSLKTAGAFQ